jgi:hypothetical protein
MSLLAHEQRAAFLSFSGLDADAEIRNFSHWSAANNLHILPRSALLKLVESRMRIIITLRRGSGHQQ